MVLKNGPWGPFMSCPGYSEDPPCKTIRRADAQEGAARRKPPVQLDEACPKCGKPLLQRDGAYGEFIACSGYPKCKYVKQELLEGAVPEGWRRHRGAEDRAGRCILWLRELSSADDFASEPEIGRRETCPCPKCESAYLLEYSNKEGTYLVCPNNREFLPKRRPRKGAPGC